MVLWAIDCAEHVLSHFGERCPRDDRPWDVIESGRAWTRGEISTGEVRVAAFAAHAAARDAGLAAARAVAPQTLPLPPPANAIGSTDAFQSTFGL